MTQKGFAPILIVIPLAIISVIGVIVFGYFTATKQTAEQTAEIPTFQPSSPPVRLGTPGCEDVDYTGCDTSADFMTWTDTGERNPPAQE